MRVLLIFILSSALSVLIGCQQKEKRAGVANYQLELEGWNLINEYKDIAKHLSLNADELNNRLLKLKFNKECISLRTPGGLELNDGFFGYSINRQIGKENEYEIHLVELYIPGSNNNRFSEGDKIVGSVSIWSIDAIVDGGGKLIVSPTGFRKEASVFKYYGSVTKTAEDYCIRLDQMSGFQMQNRPFELKVRILKK